MSCSVLCIHPCFDFWPLADSRLGWSIQELLGFSPSDVDQGFARLQEIGATRQMAEAFQAVHTYIGIIKASPNSTKDVPLLTDQRNITQHTLLCLSPASDLHSFFSHPTHAATYEACRLAALVFGVGVIFPIPAQNTPLNTLARLIRSVLLQPTSTDLWSSPSTRLPLIWVLTPRRYRGERYPRARLVRLRSRRYNAQDWLELMGQRQSRPRIHVVVRCCLRYRCRDSLAGER